MNYLGNICFKGDLFITKDFLKILDLRLLKLGIINNYSLCDENKYYFIKDNYIHCTEDIIILQNYTIVTMQEFLNLIEKQNNWFNTLSIGDEVIIAERIGDAGEYPYSFADGMTSYSGLSAKIVEIREIHPNDYHKNLRFYNGDNRKYFLDIDSSSYMWHSSMFVPTIESNIKKIELFNIKTKP